MPTASPAFERGGVLSLSSVFLFAFVCARERRLRRCLAGAQLCAIRLCVLVAIGARRAAMSPMSDQ